jgi:nucleotide-binding universal stress UspA family protein
MTYATVMVGLALGRPNDAPLEIAAQLAQRFGAKVIGIAAAEFSPPLYFTDGEAAQQLVDQGWSAVKKWMTELESQFREAMQGCATELEWRCAEDFPNRYVVQQARACDIIVVGEVGRTGIADPFAQVNPSDLVMQAGRPVIGSRRLQLAGPEKCPCRLEGYGRGAPGDQRRAASASQGNRGHRCRNCRGRGRSGGGVVAGG